MLKYLNPEEEIVNPHEDGQEEEEKISAYRHQAPRHDPWDQTWRRKNLRLHKGRRGSERPWTRTPAAPGRSRKKTEMEKEGWQS